VQPAQIRPIFRAIAGLMALALGALAVAAAVACGLAVWERVTSRSAVGGDLLLLAPAAVVLGFSARYFGCFALTGLPPRRAARRAWRIAFDLMFGLAATALSVYLLFMLPGVNRPVTETIWRATGILVLLRGFRWYWEHGAASARRRVTDR
jgi:hypothetical protein